MGAIWAPTAHRPKPSVFRGGEVGGKTGVSPPGSPPWKTVRFAEGAEMIQLVFPSSQTPTQLQNHFSNFVDGPSFTCLSGRVFPEIYG